MWERIVTIIRKELLQVLRDPRLRMMLILPPVLQLIIFGFAVNLDVENARVAWFDQDRSAESTSSATEDLAAPATALS